MKLTTKTKTTSKDIHEALAKRFCAPEWIYVREFSMLPGWTSLGRFVDGVAFNVWPSKGHIIIAFEIKVSRSDFRAELKDPSKRAAAVKMADEFYFVVPKGLVEPGEVPHECGLMEVSDDGSTRIRLKPPKPAWNFQGKYPKEMHRGLAAAILRKMNPDSIDLRNKHDAIRHRRNHEEKASKLRSIARKVKEAIDDIRVV